MSRCFVGHLKSKIIIDKWSGVQVDSRRCSRFSGGTRDLARKRLGDLESNRTTTNPVSESTSNSMQVDSRNGFKQHSKNQDLLLGRLHHNRRPISQYLSDALHNLGSVIPRPNHSVATQFGRVLQH